jgi:hypothetical protein
VASVNVATTMRRMRFEVVMSRQWCGGGIRFPTFVEGAQNAVHVQRTRDLGSAELPPGVELERDP